MDVKILHSVSMVNILLKQVTARINAKRHGQPIPTSPIGSLALRGKIDQRSYFILRKNDPNNPVQDVKFKEIA